MKKTILVSYYFLDENLLDLYGFKLSKNFEVWNISNVINNRYFESQEKNNKKYNITIKTIDMFSYHVKKHNKKINVFMMIGNSLLELPFYEILNNLNIKYIHAREIIYPANNSPFYHRLIRNLYLKKLMYKFRNFYSKKNFNSLVRPIRYMSPCTKEVFVKKNNINEKINFSSFPSKNFNQWKKINLANKLYSDTKYILYIDQSIPEHPDLLLEKTSFTFDNYYVYLNAFFKKIELHYKLPIYISAHPRFKNESDIKNKFGNRNVIFNNTPNAIHNAELIISHGSGALEFAILSYKKILMVTFDEIIKTSTFGWLSYSYAKELNLKVLRIDKAYQMNSINNLMQFNIKIYDEYINKYIHHKKSINKINPNINNLFS